MFDAGKTRMIGLPYGEKNYDDMLSRFHLIPERYVRTDGRTDRIAISISRISVLTRDKNAIQDALRELRITKVLRVQNAENLHVSVDRPIS